MSTPILCPICNSAASLFLKDVNSQYASFNAGIFKCESCGHGITYPIPNKEQLANIYKNSYSTKDHLFTISEKLRRAKTWVRIIQSKISPRFVVDIGSMFGSLIFEFQKVGITGFGIEQDVFASNYAKSLKVKTLNIDIFSASKSAEFLEVDLICLTHVLEHFENPKEALNFMLSIFPNAQYILIVVPNFESRFSKILKSNWGSLQIGTHFHHFSPNSINHLMDNLNLDIVEKRLMPGDSLLYISSLINLLGISRRNLDKNVIFANLKKFIGQILFVPTKFLGFFSKDEILVLVKIKKV